MKHVAVVILVCLLVAGTVSALPMNPGSAGASKTIVTTTTSPPVTKIPAAVAPVSIATTQGRGMLEVYSVPSGAAVTVSGAGSASGTTPAKFSLYAGTYTVKVSLAGYKDYTETFTLASGAIKDINADLKRSLSSVSASTIASAAAVTSATATIRLADTRRMTTTPPVNPVPTSVTPVPGTITVYVDTIPSGAEVIVMNQPDEGLHTPVTLHLKTGFSIVTLNKPFYHPYELVLNLTPGMATQNYTIPLTLWNETNVSIYPMACPDSDWTCLTPAEAAQQFGYPNARYGEAPCGYAQENGQTVSRYCFMDVDSGGSVPSRVLGSAAIRDGDTIYILNETWIGHGIVRKSPGASAVPLQSFFHFFSGILSGSAKPESRLDIVGFNPQPEPPGKMALGDMNNPENRLNLVGLNPQPEPPAQDPLVQNAK